MNLYWYFQFILKSTWILSNLINLIPVLYFLFSTLKTQNLNDTDIFFIPQYTHIKLKIAHQQYLKQCDYWKQFNVFFF